MFYLIKQKFNGPLSLQKSGRAKESRPENSVIVNSGACVLLVKQLLVEQDEEDSKFQRIQYESGLLRSSVPAVHSQSTLFLFSPSLTVRIPRLVACICV